MKEGEKPGWAWAVSNMDHPRNSSAPPMYIEEEAKRIGQIL